MVQLDEAGIQFHLPTFRDQTLPQLLELGRTATAAGFRQIWITDNLGGRNVFTVLAALALTVPIKLGTAVLVQYFRNPVDAAGALASVSELMAGRELDIGIAKGNHTTSGFIHGPKPISTLRETAQALRRLLAGEAVAFKDYPTLATYFNMVPNAVFKLHVRPAGPVRLFCGGNGTLSIAVGGQHMDGILFGSSFVSAAGTSQLARLIGVADKAASDASPDKRLSKVSEIKVSVSRDGQAARDFTKQSVASKMVTLRSRGYSDEDLAALGIEPAEITRFEEMAHAGVPTSKLASLVTDAMIDSVFVAGDPGSCKGRIVELCATCKRHGFQQMIFSELGPDVDEAMRLLGDEILPVVG